LYVFLKDIIDLGVRTEVFKEHLESEDIYCLSDTHFFHTNIARYCDRPKNWMRILINNWNKIISKDKTVFHLGDIAFGGKKVLRNLIEYLNGNIIMIRGNHDKRSIKWFEDVGVIIIDKFIYNRDEKRYSFCHDPSDIITVNSYIVVHGHVHNNKPFFSRRYGKIYYNLSVEMIDYEPIKLKELMNGKFEIL